VNNRIYIIDACALIDASKNYPLGKKTFQSIWDKISEMFKEERLMSSSEIFDEIKDKDISEWLKPYKSNFLPIDEEIQKNTKEVLKQFPNMININKNKKASSNGDPFLIATAIEKQGVIVTNEKNAQNKIPAVSKYFNIESINLVQFINEIMD
jgi:hypothetical protein